jgi:hypothetical protein
MARAVYRGYWQGGKRSARVTRLHIIRKALRGRRPARPVGEFRARPAQVPAQELVDDLGTVGAHLRGSLLGLFPLGVVDAD